MTKPTKTTYKGTTFKSYAQLAQHLGLTRTFVQYHLQKGVRPDELKQLYKNNQAKKLHYHNKEMSIRQLAQIHPLKPHPVTLGKRIKLMGLTRAMSTEKTPSIKQGRAIGSKDTPKQQPRKLPRPTRTQCIKPKTHDTLTKNLYCPFYDECWLQQKHNKCINPTFNTKGEL